MKDDHRSAAHAVERRIEALEAMGLPALRAEWRRVIKTDPSVRLSTDLLRRGVAYRLQEAAFGGLLGKVARQLAITATSTRQRKSVATKAGTTFIREWHGRTHTVRALDEGFEYDGRRFTSLSTIARQITGAAWSGPRFFGLTAARTGRPNATVSADA
jgi:hypothetical protein